MNYLGKPPTPFTSQDEVTLWMKDPRYSGEIYERDESFIQHVVAKLEITPDAAVSVPQNGSLEAAMSTPSPQIQDPFGEIANQHDVFHSREEAITAMSDPKYKSDPWFRAQVEAKVGRSVPDEALPQRVNGSLQVVGDDVEPGDEE